MGILFGRNAGARPSSYSEKLAGKLRRKGGQSSTGAAHLLGFMAAELGSDPRELCPEEAEQAARSLRDAAGRLRGRDREIAEQIAADAQEAADSGTTWRVG